MASDVCDMPSDMERRGAVDRRHIQQLLPVITPQDMHKKLATGREPQPEASPAYPRNRPYSSKLNKAFPAAPLATVDIIANSSGCSSDAPEGLNPDTWAALQQTAKDLDVRGVFDPKINQLHSKMLQQVKAYKDMQAAQQHAQAAQAGYAAAAATKNIYAVAHWSPLLPQQPTPAAATQAETSTFTARLEASCAQVIASLPAPVHMRPPHTSGSVMSAASGATYKTGWTCRTNKVCRAATDVGAGTESWRQQQEQQQLAGQLLQDDVQEIHLAGPCSQVLRIGNFPVHALNSSALQQLERDTSAAPMSGRQRADTQQGDGASSSRSCSCTPAPSIPASDAAATLAAGVLEWQHQASMSAAAATATHRGKETSRSRGSASLGASDSSSGAGPAAGALTQRFGMRQQSQQLGVVLEAHSEQAEAQQTKSKRITLHQKPARSLAVCVAELAASARPTTPTEQAADTAAAAIQKRLSPAACEAFQASVAAAVDNNLKLYRERLQQARQQLLQKELAEDPTQQMQQMCLNHIATARGTADREGTTSVPQSKGGSSDGVTTAVAVPGGSTVSSAAGGVTASATADAALMTMQQLVALLAKRDAAPEQVTDSLLEAKQQDGSAAVPLTATEAASRKLVAAQSMSEFLAAANEHLLAAAVQFDESGMVGSSRRMRLDLGRIARVHQMGKTWHKLTAKSNGSSSNGGSSGGSSAASTARKGRRSSIESSSGQNNGKDSTGTSSSRVVQPPPKPIAPGSAGSAKLLQVWESTAARASSAASQQLHCAPGASSAADSPAAVKTATTAAAAAAAAGCQAAGDTDHELAGMRITAPRLQAPTEQELAAVPLPALPELLDVSHEPAKVLQARLQRVWAVLQTPPEQQMDVVLRYTRRAAACSFEEALSAWETAAATVLQREGILRQLLQIRGAIQEMRQQQASDQQRQQRHTRVSFENQQQQQQQQAAGEDGSLAECSSALQQQKRLLLGLDAHQIHQLLWAFLAATEQVRMAAEWLQKITGQKLAVGAVPYPGPGAVVSASQLQLMLDKAWEVLGTGMIYS